MKQKMKKTAKFCHFTLVNGTPKEVQEFSSELGKIKDRLSEGLDFDIEFLVTNNEIQLTDLKPLIDSLTALYNKYEALRKEKLNKMYAHSPEDSKE